MPAVHDIAGEPRVSHEDLAASLGYAEPEMLRRLIDRNRNELECYGPLVRLRDLPDEVSRQIDGKPKPAGGRPSNPFLLNEGQTVLAAILSDAPRAAEVRHQVVSVFLAWRAGRKISTRSNPEMRRLKKAVRELEVGNSVLSGQLARQAEEIERLAFRRPRMRLSARDITDVDHFLAECTMRAHGSSIDHLTLFVAWERWRAKGDGRQLTPDRLVVICENAGCRVGRSPTGPCFTNLKLTSGVKIVGGAA